jgi:hypothetical protein
MSAMILVTSRPHAARGRGLVSLMAAIAAAMLAGCSAGHEATAPVSASGTLVAPTTPEALAAPADQVVLLRAHATGFQIYACKAKPDDAATFEWSLKAPEAELSDDAGKVIGKHYAGPAWESIDGSKVVGKKTAQADAPEAGAIPWLLVTATSNEGAGIMAGVKTIQRVDTHGGKAPAGGCDAAHAGAESRAPYTATYYFHGSR